MTTRQEFLGAVLPPEGIYCVVGIVGKIIQSQTFHKTILDVDVAVDALDEAGINSFVAVANFNTDRNRTAVNANQLRSFFLDLDCGVDDPKKKYPDQQSAIASLKKFVKDLKLPRPIVVNSGRGIHAYWPLTAPVERTVWKVAAERLKMLCRLHGMIIDPAVPADAARVLRAVGSSNYKDPANPLKVEVLNMVAPIDFEVMQGLLGATTPEAGDPAMTPFPKRELDSVTKALLSNMPSSFKLILQKSLKGNGCNQLADAVLNQETTSEPIWRAALSIAQHCEDRSKAIHVVSSKHPEYAHADTVAKAALIKGPYRCETFLDNNPSGCDGCKHKGKIASPIVLGRGEVEPATPEDNVVHDRTEPEKKYVIPEYPFPYVRGKHGGIYVRGKDEDDLPKDILIYDNDFYVVNTVDDPLFGMSALFRLHLPQDGVREFLIPMKDMLAKDKFGGHVASYGLNASAKGQMEALMNYTGASIKTYQKAAKAEKARLQMGWADNKTSFIIGDRQVRATDIKYSPPSAVTLGLIKAFGKVGTLEDWKKIASFYNRPGMEMQMFALFVGFSSPLVPFSNQKGGVISLYSRDAGTGKTTMLKLVNSIFGHPDELMLIKADTMNARMHRIGTMQNITATIDEITNETPELTSEFLYSYMQARGKIRLQGSINMERTNTTSWEANALVTGNAPIEDKLYYKKRNPDGEMARMLEFHWVRGNDLTKAETDKIFDELQHNYGVAGEPYMQYVIRELPANIKALEDMQQAIDKAAGLTQRERFWSNLAATPMAGGLIARAAGVLDFTDEDFGRVYKWLIDVLIEKRKAVVQVIHEPGTMLGAFLSEHINDTLIINSGVTRKPGTMQESPIREPRGKLYVRHEPDTELLYINKTQFRKFCSDGQVPFAEVLSSLTKAKRYKGEKKLRMGKGFQVTEPEVVLMFTHDGEDLFGKKAANANARSAD